MSAAIRRGADRSSPKADGQAAWVLRTGRLGDVAQLVAIENACFSSDRMTARSFRALVRKPTASLIVAEISDRIAGYALVLYRRGTSVARLYSTAVAIDRRGLGLGRALLKAAEESAKAHGALYLRLEVRTDNAAAILLYRNMGYREFGQIAHYYEDDADALRFEKSLLGHAPAGKRLIPYYPQTTEFTCAPAAMMMALKASGIALDLDQRTELRLWREATMIAMTSGLGGCGPYGIAVTLARRGLKPRIQVSSTGPLFLEGVRTPWKRKVMQVVQADYRDQANELGIPVEIAPTGIEQLSTHVAEGGLAIVLISAYRMYRERYPHWVLAYDVDERHIVVHDPWLEPADYEDPLAKAALAIPREEFDRMSMYGKSRLRAAVLLDPGTTQ